jgi:hypothetical protein
MTGNSWFLGVGRLMRFPKDCATGVIAGELRAGAHRGRRRTTDQPFDEAGPNYEPTARERLLRLAHAVVSPSASRCFFPFSSSPCGTTMAHAPPALAAAFTWPLRQLRQHQDTATSWPAICRDDKFRAARALYRTRLEADRRCCVIEGGDVATRPLPMSVPGSVRCEGWGRTRELATAFHPSSCLHGGGGLVVSQGRTPCAAGGLRIILVWRSRSDESHEPPSLEHQSERWG